MNVDKTPDFNRMRASVHAIQSFVKAKNHRCEKNQRKWHYSHKEKEIQWVHAKHDTWIPMQFVKNIEVENPSIDDGTWVVKRNLIPNFSTSYFAAPNVILNPKKPEIPLINPMDSPKYIRKGDIIGSLNRVDQYFDMI